MAKKKPRSAYDIALEPHCASVVLQALENLKTDCLDCVDAIHGAYAPRRLSFVPELYNILGAVARYTNPDVPVEDLCYDHIKGIIPELDLRILDRLSNGSDFTPYSNTYGGRFMKIRETLAHWREPRKYREGENIEIAPGAIIYLADGKKPPSESIKSKVVQYSAVSRFLTDPVSGAEVPHVSWLDGRGRWNFCSARYAALAPHAVKISHGNSRVEINGTLCYRPLSR